MPDSNLPLDFLLAATAYTWLAYSAIPLLGDLAPDRSNGPAFPWSVYQTHRASEADFQR